MSATPVVESSYPTATVTAIAVEEAHIIVQTLPPELLRRIISKLPSAHRFLAPVCKIFYDVYTEKYKEKTETSIFGISSVTQLEVHLAERNENNEVTMLSITDCLDGIVFYGATSYVAGCSGLRKLIEWNSLAFVGDAGPLTCAGAARGGHLETLKWLRDRGCRWDWRTCAGAARGGHLDTLKWSRGNGCEWDTDTCAFAAEGGHFDVLKWARANGCEWFGNTCSYAAEKGHLDILKWARTNNCEWDSDTCSYASSEGLLEVLKWARTNGCEWDSKTCSFAAEKGHLEVLKWARTNGCDWFKCTCNCAAEKGQLHILKWAIENGCPWDWRECMELAQKNEHSPVLTWIRERVMVEHPNHDNKNSSS